MHARQILDICESLKPIGNAGYADGSLVRLTEPTQFDDIDPQKAEGKVVSRVGDFYNISIGDKVVQVKGDQLASITEDKGSDAKYDAYKDKLMRKHGFDNWDDAAKDDKFMAALDKGWNADNESGDDGAVNESSEAELFGDLYDGIDYDKSKSVVDKVHAILNKSTYKKQDDVTKSFDGLSSADQKSVLALIKSAPKR